jgi:hypothetical protein
MENPPGDQGAETQDLRPGEIQGDTMDSQGGQGSGDEAPQEGATQGDATEGEGGDGQAGTAEALGKLGEGLGQLAQNNWMNAQGPMYREAAEAIRDGLAGAEQQSFTDGYNAGVQPDTPIEPGTATERSYNDATAMRDTAGGETSGSEGDVTGGSARTGGGDTTAPGSPAGDSGGGAGGPREAGALVGEAVAGQLPDAQQQGFTPEQAQAWGAGVHDVAKAVGGEFGAGFAEGWNSQVDQQAAEQRADTREQRDGTGAASRSAP